MRSNREARDDEHLLEAVTRLGRLWSRASLAESVSIRFSSRLSSTWARTNLATNAITLASKLKGDRERLHDVLCHELAHVVSHERVGRSEGPHGPTWRRLVHEAGRNPAIRLEDREATRTTSRPDARTFVHRCPICDFSRTARRPMTIWRCADCTAAGLSGELIVTEHRRPG